MTRRLAAVAEVNAGEPIGQCRAVAFNAGGARAILAVHGPDFDVDPYEEMFYFPTGTLKMIAFTPAGELLWQRDLGPGVVPGMWFCPVLPLDLDGAGIDDIYYVGSADPRHPMSLGAMRLFRLDGATGAPKAEWPWPRVRRQTMSHQYRNFLVAGRAHGATVLVTAQGTYEDMHLQAWGPGMTPRWTFDVPADAPGARGSHMCAVADLNGDGVDELMWGERCVELDRGRQLFCADEATYRDHSDVVQPVLDRATGAWRLYTCREGGNAGPRVCCYDASGRRLWGHMDAGHIDMGWVARLKDDGGHIASAIRIGHKTCGPDGRHHTGVEEFAYDVATGAPVTLPFSTYRTFPVDLDGDGLHDLVRGRAGGGGEVLDRRGRVFASIGGAAALCSKFCDLAGEQILSYADDGALRIWADPTAEDRSAALARYAHPFYEGNRRLTATGANLINLGGI